MLWKKQPIANQVATLNSNLATKVDKPVNVPEGKYLQTDANGQAVWDDLSITVDVATAQETKSYLGIA